MSRTFSFWFQVLRNWLRYLIYLKNNQYKNCQKNHISTVCIAWKSALDEFFCLGLFPAEPKGEFYIFEYIVSLLQKLQCQLGSYLVIDMKSIMGCISFQLLMFLLTTHTHYATEALRLWIDVISRQSYGLLLQFYNSKNRVYCKAVQLGCPVREVVFLKIVLSVISISTGTESAKSTTQSVRFYDLYLQWKLRIYLGPTFKG